MKAAPQIPRRSFLHAAGAGLGFLLAGFESLSSNQQDSEWQKKFDEIRANLLQLVNEERAVEKLNRLELDELACKVESEHAADMAKLDFASHWGSNGLKPYMRYSFAGGYHATQENVSAADNTWSMKFGDLIQDTSYLHVRLYQEQPPNDGHRKAILAPHHTHVGFGLAVDQLRLRLVELFVAKHVEVKFVRQIAKPKDIFTLSARLLRTDHILNSVEVFYEPLPRTPELSWLRSPRSYSLPSESVRLLPKLVPPFYYANKSAGVIDTFPDGRFNVPITLFHDEPGVYTIVCWVKHARNERAFPATEICVRADSG